MSQPESKDPSRSDPKDEQVPTVAQKVASGLAFNTLRAILSVVISIAYSVIAVRVLHIQNFGILAFLDSIFSLLGSLFMPLTHSAQSRFIPELRSQGKYPQLRRLVGVGQKVNILLAVAVAAPFLVFASPIAERLGDSSWTLYIQLMALGMVVSAVLGISKAILNALYDQKFLSIWESFFSAASLTLLVAFVVFLQWGVTGAILVGLVIYVASAIVYHVRMNTRYRAEVRGDAAPLGKALDSRIRKYVFPGAATNLVYQFESVYGGVIFLGLLADPSQVAYFDIPNTFVLRVFSHVTVVVGGLSLVSLVEVGVTDPSRLLGAARLFTKFVSIYAIPVMAGGFVLAPQILTVLYGIQILPAVDLFRVLLVATCFGSVLQVSIILLFVLEKARRAFAWSILHAAFLLGLNLLLIPTLGAMGAVIAMSTATIASAGLVTYDVAIRLKVGDFIPLLAISKTTMASIFMASALFAVSEAYRITTWASLGVMIAAGFVIYVLGLRVLRVFTDSDRRLVEASSLPLKRVMVGILWKDRKGKA